MLISSIPLLVLVATLFGASPAGDEGDSFQAVFEFKSELLSVESIYCGSGQADSASGKGEASALGAFEGRAFACFDGENLRASEGSFSFDGANGQRLIGTYEIDYVLQEEDRLEAVGRFVLTGGSGRFNAATGEGTVTGRLDQRARSGEWVLNGEVRYARPDRPVSARVIEAETLCDASMEYKGNVRPDCL